MKLTNFDYSPNTRIIFGCKSIDDIGEEAVQLGGKHVLLVTDKGVAEAGHVKGVIANLESCNLHTVIFDDVRENPTTEDVNHCLQLASEHPIDLIIGLGGGSSLDTAKGCNFLLTNGGEMKDYLGIGKAKKPMLPMIAVPTTAGTGSETQSFALISDEITHQKMACGDSKATPKIAILDPELTLSQPKKVAICTAIDAITHAVESAVTTKQNPISLLFAKEAFKMAQSGFESMVSDPENIAARSKLLLGASYAGIAIENSMLGAAHAAANPLTAHYGIVHGNAVGVMLPHIVRFNCDDSTSQKIYAELVADIGIANEKYKTDDAVNRFVERIDYLVGLAGFSDIKLGHNINEAELSMLANEASKQWTANFNPRKIVASDFARIYRKVLGC